MAVTRALFARGVVHLVGLDPTKGSEFAKTRPCLIVSPDELNQHLRTVVVLDAVEVALRRGNHRTQRQVDDRRQHGMAAGK